VGVNCSESGCQVRCFGGRLSVVVEVVGVRREGCCKRRTNLPNEGSSGVASQKRRDAASEEQ